MSSNTIADILARDHSIFATCTRCRHYAELPLKTFDPEMTISDLRRRLKCSACQSQAVEISLTTKI